jgi:hypothetical protein
VVSRESSERTHRMNSHMLQMRRRPIAALTGGGGAPIWVLRSSGIAATLDVDFVTDRAKNGASLVSISSLLACSRASSGYWPTPTARWSTSPATNCATAPRACWKRKADRSQEFTTSWSASNLSVTSDNAAAPDGTVTADLLTTTGTANGYLFDSVSVSNGSTYTWSIYVNKGTALFYWMQPNDGSAHQTWFNLTTGGRRHKRVWQHRDDRCLAKGAR